MRYFSDSKFRQTPIDELKRILANNEKIRSECAALAASNNSGAGFGSKFEYDAFRGQWAMAGETIQIARTEIASRSAAPQT